MSCGARGWTSIPTTTAGIHVYGGDLNTTPRSEWDPETFEERPFDSDHAVRLFEESNRRLQSST